MEIYNEKNEFIARGSGFIISSDGKIATNYHVIEYADTIKAVTYDDKIYTISKVVDYDKSMDIAIVKVDSTEKFPYVKLGDSSKLQLGEEVIAIGSPKGMKNTASQGIVSGIVQYEDKYKNKKSMIQTTAPISPGSSGGALFNKLGQVIGITYATIKDGQNLNFAIPINELPNINLDKNLSLDDVYKAEHILISDSGIYNGDIVDGTSEGYGKFVWNDGSVYIGEWKNGTMSGKGEYKFSDGSIYVGDYVNGLAQGNGTFTWADGSQYIGE